MEAVFGGTNKDDDEDDDRDDADGELEKASDDTAGTSARAPRLIGP